MNVEQSQHLIIEVKALLSKARQQTVKQINHIMVLTYFEIGRKIIEEEQGGKERAGYGRGVLKELSQALTHEFGKGFTVRNLELMRKFYSVYSNSKSLISNSSNQKTKSVISEMREGIFTLSWTHYLRLIRIEDELERRFYEIEATQNNWSVRELDRQLNTALYQRIAVSKDKEGVKELAEKGEIIVKPKDIIKDPFILEFVGLPEQVSYSESDLENGLIEKLESFLLELGKGFSFVARQKRITLDEDHFYVDLVFYNRLLRCFVLIDLKIGKLKHQDLGQMQMYVNYYDRKVKLVEESKTVGIVLYQYKNEALVEITLPEDNQQIFAGKYQTVLPTKEELKEILKN